MRSWLSNVALVREVLEMATLPFNPIPFANQRKMEWTTGFV
jgi:hypothetical protein